MDYFISHIYLPYSLFRLVWLVSGVHDFIYIYWGTKVWNIDINFVVFKK